VVLRRERAICYRVARTREFDTDLTHSLTFYICHSVCKPWTSTTGNKPPLDLAQVEELLQVPMNFVHW